MKENHISLENNLLLNTYEINTKKIKHTGVLLSQNTIMLLVGVNKALAFAMPSISNNIVHVV